MEGAWWWQMHRVNWLKDCFEHCIEFVEGLLNGFINLLLTFLIQ